KRSSSKPNSEANQTRELHGKLATQSRLTISQTSSNLLHPQKNPRDGVIMKNWSSILERAIEDMNQAYDVNVTEYGRYLVQRGGKERPAAACHLDVEYERTDQALKTAWQRIADLPKQIAEDVPDLSIRWYWAREFYWNIPGVMPVEEVAAHLL